jgi:hypothetical protein
VGDLGTAKNSEAAQRVKARKRRSYFQSASLGGLCGICCSGSDRNDGNDGYRHLSVLFCGPDVALRLSANLFDLTIPAAQQC